MIRGLIFDFDGLILDTELPDFQCWQEIYQAYGCHLALSAYAVCIGSRTSTFDPYTHLEEQLGRAVDREEIYRQRRHRSLELVAQQPVLPGVREYIAEAKRRELKLAVASSSSRDWVAGHLARLELLPFFDCLKCGDEVTATKPDPELYHAALATLGLRAEETIALEDSPNGVTAAKAAGIFCVAVPNPLTQQLSLGHADLRLSSLTDLPFEQLLETPRQANTVRS
jgi:HAD superfamily hydrolase (TIGR01509 family)